MADDIKTQIAAMSDSLRNPTVGAEGGEGSESTAPSSEPAGEPREGEVEGATSEGGTTEEGAGEAGTEEAGGEDAGEGETGGEDEATALRRQLDEIMGRLRTVGEPAPKQETPPPAPTPPAPTEGAFDFVGDQNPEELLSNKDKLNALLNTIYKKAKQDSAETVARSLPQMVKANVAQQTQLREAAQEFYKKNPDLAQFKNVMAAVAEEVASKHPDWTLQKIFDESGKDARKRLQLVKAATSGTKSNPGFVQRGQTATRRPAQPQLKGLAKDIQEMNTALGIKT